MKLYVGNLPFSTTDNELRDMFTPFGEVASASVLVDKMTGRSRGFGFVEMNNNDEANNAINSLNGKNVGGRDLTVNEARPQAPRGERPDRGSYRPRY